MIFEATDAERLAEGLASFEDRRMWRLLLARLHPDAGGDHDLFAFACAIRDEVSNGNRTGNAGSTDSAAAPFLQAWRESMGHWSSSNHDALKNIS